MRLFQLAWGCRLFGEMAGDDTASDELRSVTGANVDLDDPEHAKALLVWLNKWGCRQFAIAHHDSAARMLADRARGGCPCCRSAMRRSRS